MVWVGDLGCCSIALGLRGFGGFVVEGFGWFWVDLVIWLVFCFLVGWYNIGFLRVGSLGLLVISGSC